MFPWSSSFQLVLCAEKKKKKWWSAVRKSKCRKYLSFCFCISKRSNWKMLLACSVPLLIVGVRHLFMFCFNTQKVGCFLEKTLLSATFAKQTRTVVKTLYIAFMKTSHVYNILSLSRKPWKNILQIAANKSSFQAPTKIFPMSTYILVQIETITLI